MTTPKQIALSLEQQIMLIRGERVMLDATLAVLYGVETRVLLQAVKRNIDRFPADFMFQLTREEFQHLRSQNVISSWGGRRYPPYAPLQSKEWLCCPAY
jgi:ORF6N domain